MKLLKLLKLSTSFKTITLATFTCITLSACQSTSFTDGFMQNSIFNRKPALEPKYEPILVLGTMQMLTIAPIRVPCQYASSPMQCLVAKTDDNNVFEIPYNYIGGFKPVKGLSYKINVRPFIDQNKQTQTGKWQLDSIVSQQAVNQ